MLMFDTTFTFAWGYNSIFVPSLQVNDFIPPDLYTTPYEDYFWYSYMETTSKQGRVAPYRVAGINGSNCPYNRSYHKSKAIFSGCVVSTFRRYVTCSFGG